AIRRASVAASLRAGAPRDDGAIFSRSRRGADPAARAVRNEGEGAGRRDRPARRTQRCVLSCRVPIPRHYLSLMEQCRTRLGIETCFGVELLPRTAPHCTHTCEQRELRGKPVVASLSFA